MEELKDIELSPDKHQSLQNQLYQAIRSRIISGRYPAGLKLPASRRIAEELGISRNTVLLTMDHLEAEGYVEAKKGAGTFVTEMIPDNFSEADQKIYSRPKIKSTQKEKRLSPSAYFAPGVPDLEAFPLTIWKKLLKLHSGRTALMGYDSNQGYAPLRAALAQYLRTSRACDCHEDQIIITDGAQQALSLAAQVLLKEGEKVYVENPGYVRARKAFQARGCNVIGIDVDEQGLKPSHLPEAPEGKVLCLTPTHQYPMGGVLSLQRRMEILSWLKKHNVWLLEDDYDSEFHFYQKPIAAMQSLGLANQVIYMGSFSKVIYPALRLGYLLVPKELLAAFVSAKYHMSGESNLLEQAVTADFINEGHFNRHLLRMRKRYESKLNILLEQCSRIPGIKPITPAAGMHIVLLLDNSKAGFDLKVVDQIRQQGVNVNALSDYYLDEPKAKTKNKPAQQGLVIGFANASESQIIQGFAVIERIINSYPDMPTTHN